MLCERFTTADEHWHRLVLTPFVSEECIGLESCRACPLSPPKTTAVQFQKRCLPSPGCRSAGLSKGPLSVPRRVTPL
jgi:hypothetical protein